MFGRESSVWQGGIRGRRGRKTKTKKLFVLCVVLCCWSGWSGEKNGPRVVGEIGGPEVPRIFEKEVLLVCCGVCGKVGGGGCDCDFGMCLFLIFDFLGKGE